MVSNQIYSSRNFHHPNHSTQSGLCLPDQSEKEQGILHALYAWYWNTILKYPRVRHFDTVLNKSM